MCFSSSYGQQSQSGVATGYPSSSTQQQPQSYQRTQGYQQPQGISIKKL